MKILDVLMAAILLLSVTVFVTQSALAEESMSKANASPSASPNETELVSFVESAVAYAKENGKDMALKEFSNKTGSFINGELYIFAYDFNGTCIAHPFKTDWIGENKLNESDSNGVLYVRDGINAAKEGTGFHYLIFPNPSHDNKDELKLAYAMKVDDNWFLGSGLYLSNISASFDQEARDELVAYVNEALQFAQETGKEDSLGVFNDLNGNFTRDGRYIFARDYNGRSLALPYQPEVIGTNGIDDQDPNGVYLIRQLIDVAKRGNGFTYYIYPDPSRNMTQTLKLSYVANVDNTWFMGSGIYAHMSSVKDFMILY
jgi:polar amino acid transport system substrate-binding protein